MIDASSEAAIAAYRAKLARVADMSAADLDELTGHLRALIEELCATGLAPAAAVAEATRRLGEPRTIAREHGRVRSEFGPRPSRMRAWSAAVLLLAGFAPVIYSLVAYGPFGVSSIANLTARQLILLGVVLGPWALLVVALARRASWAPMVVLGALLPILVGIVGSRPPDPGTNDDPTWFALNVLSTVATPACALLVLPWRRAELTLRGAAALLFTWSLVEFPSVMQMLERGAHDAMLASGVVWCLTLGCTVSAVLRAPWLTFCGTCAVVMGVMTLIVLDDASASTYAEVVSVTVALATATALSWYAAHRRQRSRVVAT